MRRENKIERLKRELAKDEADIQADAYVVLTTDADIDRFFARLRSKPKLERNRGRAKDS